MGHRHCRHPSALPSPAPTPAPTTVPTPAPTSWSIDVTSPIDDTYWVWGETYAIAWDSLSSGAAIDVSLYAGSTFESNIALDVTTGSYSWTVPRYGEVTCNRYIQTTPRNPATLFLLLSLNMMSLQCS